MRTALICGKEDVQFRDVPDPAPGPGEVVVRVRTATTCGTDLKVFRNGGHPKMIRPPAPFGHEGAGEIAAVGQGVKGFHEGDRVVWNNSAPCGACHYCKRDDPSLCEDLLFLNGTYAERIKIPARIVEKNLLHIPQGLSFDRAAMTEPLACVIHGWGRIAVRKDESAVLVGDGAIGLFFVALAKAQGIRLYVVGGTEERLQIASELGAAGVLSRRAGRDATAWLSEQLGGPHGPDVAIEAVGTPEAWQDAVRYARPGGRVLLFGGCAKDTTVTFTTERLHYEAMSLIGVFHNTPQTFRKSLELLTGPVGEALEQKLLAPAASLDALPQALADMRERRVFKVPIHP